MAAFAMFTKCEWQKTNKVWKLCTIISSDICPTNITEKWEKKVIQSIQWSCTSFKVIFNVYIRLCDVIECGDG